MPRVSGVLTWAWGGEGGVPQFSGEQTRSGPYLGHQGDEVSVSVYAG